MNQREVRIRRSRAPTVSTTSRAFSLSTKRADTSRQIYQEDEFGALAATKAWLNPPYKPDFLEDCRERSNMLNQCIAAIEVNVGMSGFEVIPAKDGQKVDEAEKEELESFIESANSEESLVAVHAKIINDYEGYGYAFLEAIRDRKKRITMLRHARAGTVRLLPKDDVPQPVTYEVQRGRRIASVTEYRTFRRYVQIVNGRYRYFKEYGDPRALNMDTGEFGACPEAQQATELIHIHQQSNESYGIPRWINQLPSVLGSRESEECNLRYFEDNTVPPAILSVAGGRLTGQSYKELTGLLHNQGIGKERQNKILLIEAVPERESLDGKEGTVQIRLDKLADARQGDGLFKAYDESNQSKIRSSFRLPPVAVGLSQDVTFATANVSAFIAESQVYAPLRKIFEEVYNKRLVHSANGLGLKTVKLSSRVPAITNSETLMKALTALNVMGALTPRIANETANKILGIEIPPYPDKDTEGWEAWMDQPIALSLKGGSTGGADDNTEDPAGAGNTHDGQSVKDDQTKQIEKEGKTILPPEHGQE